MGRAGPRALCFYDPNVIGSNYTEVGARPEGPGEFLFSSQDARKYVFAIVAPKALIEGTFFVS
jgi:hypothetical protein